MAENLKEKEPGSSADANETADITPEEILEQIPAEHRGRIAAIIKHTMISGVMKSGGPLSDKITSEHISEIIRKSDEQDKRDREERKSERNYNLALVIIALLFIGFLIVYLQNNEQLLVKIVIAIVSFIGGYGFGKTKK